jgi:predicted TIM-barrel fold metal-dependent hydrolase
MANADAVFDHMTWSDAHLHVWDAAELRAPWFTQAPHFAGSFNLSRVASEGGTGGPVVLVEADMAPSDSAREAQSLAASARAEGRRFAIVAAVDLGAADFAAQLDAVAEITEVRGARRVFHARDVPFGTTRFLADLRVLGSHGFSFDFCTRWSDLALVEHSARSAPDAMIILDHLGNPPLRAGWLSPERLEWQRLVARVAACDNVSVKWSAMFENAGRALSADEARPWVEWCLECFGPTRVMWGSNWPVCFATTRLTQWIRVTTEIATAWSADERRAVLMENALRIYRF